VSTNFIQAGRRYQFTSTVLHHAGDLVYKDGYFGVIQDDVHTVGDKVMMILEGVWLLRNPLGTAAGMAPGDLVYANAVHYATTLQVQAAASQGASGPLNFGKVWASGNASLVAVKLIRP